MKQTFKRCREYLDHQHKLDSANIVSGHSMDRNSKKNQHLGVDCDQPLHGRAIASLIDVIK